MHPEIQAVLDDKQRWAVVQGDCLESLDSLPPDSVNLCFGSPPYVQARLYLEDGQDLGIARNVEEWTAWMVGVFTACRRVCIGLVGMVVGGQTRNYSYDCAPDLLRADLRRGGFTLRKSPIYRRVGIPGSGGPDFLRNDYEPIVVTTRGGKLPWSDNTACGHPPKWAPGGEMSYRNAEGKRKNAVVKFGSNECRYGSQARKEIRQELARRLPLDGTRRKDGSKEPWDYIPPEKANPGNVIDCSVGGGRMGSDLAHGNEAPFPESLAEFFILSFCPPGGIVCDPFAGSGTTLAAAVKHGRRAIGFDLRQSQVELTRRRLSGVTPSLFCGKESSCIESKS